MDLELLRQMEELLEEVRLLKLESSKLYDEKEWLKGQLARADRQNAKLLQQVRDLRSQGTEREEIGRLMESERCEQLRARLLEAESRAVSYQQRATLCESLVRSYQSSVANSESLFLRYQQERLQERARQRLEVQRLEERVRGLQRQVRERDELLRAGNELRLRALHE